MTEELLFDNFYVFSETWSKVIWDWLIQVFNGERVSKRKVLNSYLDYQKTISELLRRIESFYNLRLLSYFERSFSSFVSFCQNIWIYVHTHGWVIQDVVRWVKWKKRGQAKSIFNDFIYGTLSLNDK